LQALIDVPASQTTSTFHLNGELKCNFPEQAYYQAFDKIQHYIREGDCYQVNLAKRYEIETLGEPWEAYQRLRHLNAAPFSAYFSTENLTVMSSSPERLLKVKDQQVETKPIKGTRRRDLTDPQKDKAMADALQKSLKDRAENLMIVDLLRNDLGKVCKPGSIQVPKPFELESFATVHHLVSTITGTLAEKASAIALLRACFPGGSITGAPKLRAMEIIEELEPHRRGVYCGSIGYIGFDGNMDSNITIRTLVHSENRLRFWAGGGIVADSHADEEYQEAHDKAAAMIALIDSFSDS
jgi:para-aminobenzoate synthetase component 1